MSRPYRGIASRLSVASDDALIDFALRNTASAWRSMAAHNDRVSDDTKALWRALAQRATNLRMQRKTL